MITGFGCIVKNKPLDRLIQENEMTRNELFELLDKLEIESGLRFDCGESFEGVQYIRFEIEEESEDE